MMQLVSIEGGRVDHEDFEECGNLDFYGPLSMLDMLEDVCIYLYRYARRIKQGADLEEAMAQVRKIHYFRKLSAHVQNDLQTALWPRLRNGKHCGKNTRQHTILPEQ